MRRASSSWRFRAFVFALAMVIVAASCAVVVAANEDDGPVEALPPREAATEDRDEQPVRRIKFGEKVRVDNFGPVIINADCTTSYIENWETLSTRERAATYRRIGARNRERHAECKRREERDEL